MKIARVTRSSGTASKTPGAFGKKPVKRPAKNRSLFPGCSVLTGQACNERRRKENRMIKGSGMTRKALHRLLKVLRRLDGVIETVAA